MESKINQNESNNEPLIPFFHQRFNLSIDLDDVKIAFVNRIENQLDIKFIWLENYYFADSDQYRTENWVSIFTYIAHKMGIRYRYDDLFSGYHRGALDFHLFLRLVEALYEALGKFISSRQKELEGIIESAIEQSEIDLGILWRNGAFWPSGAKILDVRLINENLDWLSSNKYSNVLIPFEKGLRDFLESQNKPERLSDTVTDMYEALESMAKVTTERNNRDLSGNKELFINKLHLSEHFNKMLGDYIAYANQYRHGLEANRKRIQPQYNEVEAFIYSTGLFIRLAVKQLEANDKT
jgi:hypothetical protein